MRERKKTNINKINHRKQKSEAHQNEVNNQILKKGRQ